MNFSDMITKLKIKIKKPKKADRRRRSNWYIYLISFAATSLLLGLFIAAFQDILFPQTAIGHIEQGRGSYSPAPELNTVALFMMSDEPGSIPSMYMLVNYRPRDGVIVLVPLDEDTRLEVRGSGLRGGTSGRLVDLYRIGHGELVSAGISDTFGVDCEYHVTFSRSSFTTFTALLGEVQVNVPAFFQSGSLVLSVGEHMLAGGDLFTYLNYAEFSATEHPDALLNIIGQSMTFFVNTSLRNMTELEINNTFNRVLNNATTNLTFTDFRTYQRALHHTSNNAINPAGAYIPTGTREGHEFILSAESIAEIRELFGAED
jgi:hypothetical protein